ncbi:hypothetical protein [Persicobacter sp. CCB-QB2]|uniref:hypothetical protein n=1 Tax=Persicobacter sp. CCB-QB2 TaxID=1561025 RepID=UPI0006A99110|nr:hypothetical protein [Persicobacter sp. CCB-QB2]
MQLISVLTLCFLPLLSIAQIKVAAKDATAAEINAANLKCNGNADQKEINDALKQGKIVELSSGTFNCNGEIKGGNNILRGQGKNATKIITTAKNGIHFEGRLLARFNATGELNAGSNAINVRGNPNIGSGDIILIASDDLYCGLRGYYMNGEGAVVKSAIGGTINLQQPLKLDYKKNARIVTYQFHDNVGMENFTLETRNGEVALMIKYATNAFYKNIDLIDPTEKCWQGFSVNNVYGFEYSNLYASGILHGRSTTTPHGYGFYISGAEDGIIKNCKGYNNKHSFEISGYLEVPVSRNIRLENCETDNDWRAGFSTHGAASDIDWINCTAKNANGGFLIRSDNNRIINPVVECRDYNSAFFIGEYTQQNGTWDKFDGIGGDNLYIENPTVDGAGVTNCYFEFRDPIRNMEVVGGSFTGAKNGLLIFYGMECSNFTLKNCYFNIKGLKHLFEMQPGKGETTYNTTLQVSFENVQLCGGGAPQDLLTSPVATDLQFSGIDWNCD